MAESGLSQGSNPAIAVDLEISDLRRALVAGWSDFRARPAFGLFFSAIFAAGGWLLSYVLFVTGELTWLIPAAAGFPLLAPFSAVGLYEVSRRREAGIASTWSGVLGAVKGRGDDQILAMGVIIFVAFGFWVIVAHAVFSIALVESGSDSEGLAFLLTRGGVLMLAVGSAMGGVMALAFYAMTVVSLPMLLDREIDLVTAIITSFAVFNANKAIMLAWAFCIAASLALAMLTAFIGLFVMLPVLGHATWHLYRRAVAA